MKKFVKLFLFGALFLILLASGWAAYWMVLNKQLGQQAKLIQKASNSTLTFTFLTSYPVDRGNPYEAIAFEIPTERDVQLHNLARRLDS
jgi:hypothetical protein